MCTSESRPKNFINRFQNKSITDDIPHIEVKVSKDELRVIDLITKDLNVIGSTSEVRRLINQKAVKIDSKPVTSIDFDCSGLTVFLLQIGKKKAYRISLK